MDADWVAHVIVNYSGTSSRWSRNISTGDTEIGEKCGEGEVKMYGRYLTVDDLCDFWSAK